jgi:hypothetical protein
MKRSLYLLSFIALIAISSCDRRSPQQKLEDMIPTKYVNAKTVMSFQDTLFDFGTIPQGAVVKHVFSFKNTGKNDLLIVNGFGSCGCTVPEYPKQPIKAGESAEIKVQFNSEGKEGMQNKKVFLIGNTEPTTTVLTIKAMVTSPVKK